MVVIKRNKKGQFLKGTKINLGRKHTLKTKNKISKIVKERSNDKNYLKKLSEAHKGPKHYMFGKNHKKESIKKMSETKLKLYKNPENHPRWLGGKIRYYHDIGRKVIEETIGRKINKYECVHHLDGNWKNNNIDNLIVFPTRAEHTIYHRFLRDCVNEMLESE